MIIERYDKSKNAIISTTWKFKGDDQEYLTSCNICKNPYCKCTEMTFGIRINLKSKPVASFSIDIENNKVKIVHSHDSSKLLSKKLVSELSQEDKKILHYIFRYEKEKITNEINIDEIEPPVFPVNEIENDSLMVDYKEIFPWSKIYWFELNDKTYHLIDHYCLHSTCNCSEVGIDFLAFQGDTHLNEKEPTLISYNCITGKWEVTQVSKNFDSPSLLMNKMILKYPDIRQIFLKRRNRLRILYKRYREYNGIKTTTENILTSKITGRNDPCPCGSGKKYKKCCGKK